MGRYDKWVQEGRIQDIVHDVRQRQSRPEAVRKAFGEYIVERQAEENLHKTFQVYKDDYVLELIHRWNHPYLTQQVEAVIRTYASDLKDFNIGGQYV